MNDNQIDITTTSGQINDPLGLLKRAEQITFSTCYPGGYYDTFNCFIPCDPLTPLPFTYMDVLRVRNGLTVVWYGRIVSVTLVIGTDRSGIEVSAVGQLAYFKYTSGIRRWIDRRFSSNMAGVWSYQTNAYSEQCTPDQYNRLMLTPKAVAWADGDYVAFRYSRKQSSYIRRIKRSEEHTSELQSHACA